MDLQSRVPGELLGWRRTTTGEWVGWVCVPISQGEEVRYVYQYVAAGLLRGPGDGGQTHDGPATPRGGTGPSSQLRVISS